MLRKKEIAEVVEAMKESKKKSFALVLTPGKLWAVAVALVPVVTGAFGLGNYLGVAAVDLAKTQAQQTCALEKNEFVKQIGDLEVENIRLKKRLAEYGETVVALSSKLGSGEVGIDVDKASAGEIVNTVVASQRIEKMETVAKAVSDEVVPVDAYVTGRPAKAAPAKPAAAKR